MYFSRFPFKIGKNSQFSEQVLVHIFNSSIFPANNILNEVVWKREEVEGVKEGKKKIQVEDKVRQ